MTFSEIWKSIINEEVSKNVSRVLSICGLLANFFGFLICLTDGTPIVGKIATGSSLLFVIVFSYLAFRFKWYEIYNLAVTFVCCNVLFPMIFFGTGGIKKAFILYLFIAAVAYGISMKNIWHLIFPISTLVEYDFVIAFSYNQYASIGMADDIRLKTILLGFNVVFCFIFIFLSFITFITYKYYEISKKQIFQDELTSLYNRRKFNEDITQEKYKIAIMMDIDDFRNANNKYGHQYGDFVLQKLASICLTFACDEFKIYRYGGEEFFILSRLSKEKTLENLRNIQNVFCENLSQTLSIGAVTKYDYEPYQQIVKRADKNMYFVKHNGKNQICFDGDFVKS